jgi:3-dehydroquinate synthase
MPEEKKAESPPTGPSHRELDSIAINRVDHTARSSYPIYFGRDVLKAMVPAMVRGRKILIVTTPTVHAYYGQLLIEVSDGGLNNGDFLVLDCTETGKNIEQVETVAARALSTLDRNGLVVGFGGGIVMDIACFAASMIRRGVGFVKIPTTLVGQVDAGIGIKGGVNFADKKSFLGCFYAPETVLIQPAFLATLERRHISAGLAEMLKMAIIADARLFALIETFSAEFLDSGFMSPYPQANDALITSINLMLDELRSNLTEKESYERSVDFGHTFSPALEAAIQFSLPHGFIVSIDMALSAALSVERGSLAAEAMNRIVSCLQAAGLPTSHPKLTTDLCLKALHDAEAHRGGNANLVVPTAVGACDFVRSRHEISESMLRAALQNIQRASGDTLVSSGLVAAARLDRAQVAS